MLFLGALEKSTMVTSLLESNAIPLLEHDVVPEAAPVSFTVNMQRQSFVLPGCVEVALALAIEQAVVYLPFFGAKGMFPLPSLHDLSEFFLRCKAEFVSGKAEASACEAAKAFGGIPHDVLDDNISLLNDSFDGSLPGLVQHIQTSMQQDRFNEERCRDVFSLDPEFDTLLRLAREGASIPVEDDFVVQSSPEPLRKLHVRLGQCIPQHAFKLWKAGKALLFRVADLPRQLVLHFNNSHWTPKLDSIFGRYLFDCANIAEGSTINSEYAFDVAERQYGKLSHPTILAILIGAVGLATMLRCPLSDLRLWKDDISGAFGQFNFNPHSCYLLATQVASGIVMIYLSGCFGYHACPLIFGVFSRAIARVIALQCAGSVHIYVDDLIGFSHFSVAETDQSMAQGVIIRTFGPKSLADKSLLPSLSGEVLGWTIDLASELIRPNDKAIRKLMFAFFSVDLHATRWPLQRCQMLASLAQRYSLALSGMKNFVQPLNNLCGHVGNMKSVRVSSAAKFAVEMWRVVAICLYACPTSLAVPISVLIMDKTKNPQFYVISDAGPDLAGFAVYDAIGTLLFYSAYEWPFVRNDNYQNAKEFLAFLLALVSLVVFRDIKDCCIHWTGDNSSALSWVDKQRCSSSFAQLAFTAFSFLSLRRKIDVIEVKHRPGHLMGAIDALSRRKAHNLPPGLLMPIDNCKIINELVMLCDPVLMLEARVSDHHIALQKVFRVVDELV